VKKGKKCCVGTYTRGMGNKKKTKKNTKTKGCGKDVCKIHRMDMKYVKVTSKIKDQRKGLSGKAIGKRDK